MGGGPTPERLNLFCVPTILWQKQAPTGSRSKIKRRLPSVRLLPDENLCDWGCGIHRLQFHSARSWGRRHYEIVNYDKLTYAGNLANLESVAENRTIGLFAVISAMQPRLKRRRTTANRA